MGIAFRCEDELNCWTLTARVEFGTWQLTKITGLDVIDMQNVGQVPIADGTRVRVELRREGFDVYVNDVLARHVDSTELQRQAAIGPRARRRRRRVGTLRPRSGRCSTTSSGPARRSTTTSSARATGSLGSTSTGQRWQRRERHLGHPAR